MDCQDAFLNTGVVRAVMFCGALKDAPLDAPVHLDSKLEQFDGRREILIRQHSLSPPPLPDVPHAFFAAVDHVLSYELC